MQKFLRVYRFCEVGYQSYYFNSVGADTNRSVNFDKTIYMLNHGKLRIYYLYLICIQKRSFCPFLHQIIEREREQERGREVMEGEVETGRERGGGGKGRQMMDCPFQER